MLLWLSKIQRKRPVFLEVRSSSRFIIVVVCTAIFTGRFPAIVSTETMLISA